jgi:hypothetical protein
MSSEIEIDYKKVEEAGAFDCTLQECAVHCGVSENTIKRRFNNDPLFIEAWQRGQARCKLNLRRLGWRHAKGFGPQAVTAWIHLTKHVLGWTEKSTMEVHGTIQHEVVGQRASDLLCAGFDPRCLTQQEAEELQDLCEALDEAGSLRQLGRAKRLRLLELIERGSGDNIVDAEFKEVTPELPAPAVTEITLTESEKPTNDDPVVD